MPGQAESSLCDERMFFLKKIWISVFIALLLLAVLFVFIYIKGLYPIRFYETTWNVDIPDSATEEYSFETVTALNGECTKFSVLTVDGENSFFDDFKSGKNNQFESRMKDILEQIDCDENYYPDFSKEYLWNLKTVVDDSLYMMYDYETEKLFIIADVW